MSRVFGPARQPNVDLGDGAMPVPLEERAELALEHRR